MKMRHFSLLALACVCALTAATAPAEQARNPIIWADVPDNSIIRVGDTYYMSSTTMHMSPGLPIMKSKDLVNWELASYAYDTLADNDALNLQNGRSAYGAGSWASSLRHHDGMFIVSTFSSTTGNTHIFKTRDVDTGPWEEIRFAPSLHDNSLFFDDDGRVYMMHGVGNLRLVELEPDLSGIKADGFDEVVIRNASSVAGPNIMLQAEGSQMWKVDGKYYVFNITWPRNDMRTQLVHRADKITGPYEGRVIMKDRGIAQGGIVDTPDGKWWAYLFQDHGAVGRIPHIIPMKWEDGWPVFGVDGKVPERLDLPDNSEGLKGIVASDTFDREPGDRPLPLAWQWNHNPDNAHWSLTARPGWLRLSNGRVDASLLQSRNTLTQRTFGPVSAAMTAMDVSSMKDGDVAGMMALQRRFGYVGVKQEDGVRSIVMARAENDAPQEIASLPLEGNVVHLRIDCDYRDRTDKAYFSYSLDGESWTRIGDTLQMSYTLPHFMGYRFGLFNQGTKEAGGHVDFDFYRVSDEIIAAE